MFLFSLALWLIAHGRRWDLRDPIRRSCIHLWWSRRIYRLQFIIQKVYLLIIYDRLIFLSNRILIPIVLLPHLIPRKCKLVIQRRRVSHPTSLARNKVKYIRYWLGRCVSFTLSRKLHWRHGLPEIVWVNKLRTARSIPILLYWLINYLLVLLEGRNQCSMCLF